jgi:hypothetical protein
LRSKRCLPAKFHPKTAHHYRLNLKVRTNAIYADRFVLQVPQVATDNSHSPKARQLTLFYQLLPHLCRIRAQG